MMVETEHTPNPDTLKFLPGKKVSEIGPIELLKSDKNAKVPLANKILSLEGTVMVFFGEDFITVKKERNLKWEDLKHGIISEINDHYSKGNEVIVKRDLYKSEKTSTPGQSHDVVSKIIEISNKAKKILDKFPKSKYKEALNLAVDFNINRIH